jgi:hypothetical protein
MKKITLRHLGPIHDISELPLQDCMLLIGPQASGKSTLAKAVYFFKQLRLEMIRAFFGQLENPLAPPTVYDSLTHFATHKLNDFWGISTISNPNLFLEFWYTPEARISFKAHNGGLLIDLSEAFQAFFKDIVLEILALHKKHPSNRPVIDLELKTLRDTEFGILKSKIIQKINDFLEEHEEPLFIPAGRQLFTHLENWGHSMVQDSATLFQRFQGEIARIRNLFSSGDAGLIALSPENPYTQKALRFSQKILKGEFRSVNGNNLIFLLDNTSIQVQHASSGQQESLWILNLILSRIVSENKVFLVVEEPEAHLFPDAQKDMVELIALLANANQGNQVMITTHSPYILTAFNNLMYAPQVAEEKGDVVSDILDKDLWLAPGRCAAYFMENGALHSIMQEGQIDASAIDGASESIMDTADKLVHIKLN